MAAASFANDAVNEVPDSCDNSQPMLTPLKAVPVYLDNNGEYSIAEYNDYNDSFYDAENSYLDQSYIDSGVPAFDSQPVSNQLFYDASAMGLNNLPRELYIEKLLVMTKSNEDEMSFYRNILLQRAKQSSECPQSTLVNRRTTKLINSVNRYASDCYDLQEFINNNDPKCIVHLFTKKSVIKIEPHENDDITPLNLPKTIQIELAQMKANISDLVHDVTNLKCNETKYVNRIAELEKEITIMKRSKSPNNSYDKASKHLSTQICPENLKEGQSFHVNKQIGAQKESSSKIDNQSTITKNSGTQQVVNQTFVQNPVPKTTFVQNPVPKTTFVQNRYRKPTKYPPCFSRSKTKPKRKNQSMTKPSLKECPTQM